MGRHERWGSIAQMVLKKERAMFTFKERTYVATIPRDVEAILAGDVGGTNCNFGIFQLVDGELSLLFSVHFKSQEITNFTDVIKQVLAHVQTAYQITIKKACLAAAGVVDPERHYSKPTNLPFIIDTQEIKKASGLACVMLANDFEVIGYGLDRIDPKDLVKVKEGKEKQKANKAILGAGTGLGKCILLWDHHRGYYVPVASEGGHADLAVRSELELELIAFIQNLEHKSCAISWEDVLSGYGIQRLYKFFRHKNKKIKANEFLEKNGLHPDEIFNNRHLDQHSWNTFELYSSFYARCAKNFALDALALGGVYIAGGIAAKNLHLFEQQGFHDEFINCGKQQQLLQDIPIYVITDYNISLYGAAEYLRLEEL